MFKNKTLKRIIYFSIMCLCAILLCFVGVYAYDTNKLKIYSKIDPNILCKVVLVSGALDDDSGNAVSNKVIFDNHNTDTNGNHTGNASGNTTPSSFVGSSGSTASLLQFQLINYTTDKQVRLIIRDTNNNIVVTAVCGEATESGDVITPQTSTIETWEISSTGSASAQVSVGFSISLEEVHKITVSGEGLASAGDYYFSSSDTATIDLVPQVGYQLPQNVTSSHACCTEYTTTNNTQGTATFSSITADQTLTCNCEKVFTIYQNTASSMFSGSTTTATHSSSDNLLPNNGDYTITNNTTYTKGASFKEYEYYVEMGYYPQSLEYSFTPDDEPADIVNNTYTKCSNISGYKHLNSAINMYWYKKNNDYYVCSPINVLANSVGLNSGAITSTTTGYYGMFKLEPIVWTVIGAKSGDSDVLDSLYYSNNMLYTDNSCGKLFTGQLELMSAYGLDATYYNSSSGGANYSSSTITSTLNNSDTWFDKNNRILNTSEHLSNLNNNYLASQTIKTLENSALLTETTGTTLFCLGYGIDDSTPSNPTDVNENYIYSTYFKNGVPEGSSGATYSVGVASLSDFAIAHSAENGTHTTTSGSNYTDIQAATSMGWSCGSSNITHQNTSSCAYWLRTAHVTGTSAYVINLNGMAVYTNTADTNICVRPCTVLDLGYYNTSSSNKFYNSNQYKSVNEEITIESASSSYITNNALPVPTKTGYTFTGWYTAQTGGTQVADDDGQLKASVSVDSTNYTNSNSAWEKTTETILYAHWTAVNYSISYNLDGGTVETANPTTYTIESNAITLNNPTKVGYTFAGWSGTGLTGDNNMTVTIPLGSTGTRTYTAHWTENS